MRLSLELDEDEEKKSRDGNEECNVQGSGDDKAGL